MLKGYKRKYYLLMILYLTIFIVACVGPVSQTLKLRGEVIAMQSELKKLDNAPERIIQVRKAIEDLDRIVGINDSLKVNQQQLFLCLGSLCYENSLVIREIPEEHQFNGDHICINTYLFTIEGGFIHLLKTIREFEKAMPAVNVVSLEFKKVIDRRTKKVRLLAELRVQTARKI